MQVSKMGLVIFLLLSCSVVLGSVVLSGQTRTDLSQELVAYWKFDEGGGNILFDETENSNDGTIHEATWAAGKLGSALEFDGVNDYVDCGNMGKPTQWTVVVWIKPTGSLTDGAIVKSRKGNYTEWGPEILKGRLRTYITDEVGDTYQLATSSIGASELPVGTWSYIGITVDGSYVKFYLNGILHDTITQTKQMTGTSGSLSIGRSGSSNSSYWRGTIDEVRIYNRALTETEIKELYQQGQKG